MADQQSGLRFDIYERVHVQEEVSAIQELNEVELIPHIQVLTENEQAILKGNLLLTGSYTTDSGEDIRTLEHLIPVEITLPLNRIGRLEEVAVEIENFDIDLLTPRSLNVTGVLSLQGVEMISSDNDDWNEEEMLFVHEAENTRAEPSAEIPAAAENEKLVEVVELPTVLLTKAVNDPGTEPSSEFSENQALAVFADEEAAPLVQDEKKEMKLAFGKKADEAVEMKSYGLKTLLSKANSVLHADKRKDEAASAASAAEESKSDAVEWKKLFLQSEGETQEFRKVRMCIVQKEETLETIAKRYQVNTRELQLINRLSDQEITAGQIIYLSK
ncbi:LysM peptidoglycan-binding domain-containing protein [Paenibacillus eucommiae]|uniref:Stage VI sporulation protein D n=1 Tax=Paenibacillus eucommiae TaxID=1355755 RepID=A0ABS4J7V0_9BACL|nr:LysM peptidoglycan-binding domain-containing protein [Paenibacillus eucommiae]MBP1995931.1 stage VI sporulation protein D [Paenibacillus eucommiae]